MSLKTTQDPRTAGTRAVGRKEGAQLVCHCRRVTYGVVEDAIESQGARSLVDLQRQTSACTHCFGCRFELDRMLEQRLGDEYQRAPLATRLAERESFAGRLQRRLRGGRVELPRRMYVPVLHGFGGREVTTKVVVFNLADKVTMQGEVPIRADLLALDGTRHSVWYKRVLAGGSAVLEVSALDAAGDLPGGVGILKIVVEAESLASLRPYFHLESAAGITSTHEKASTDPGRPPHQRSYHWLFPIGGHPGEEAYFFFTNTQAAPLEVHRLIWNGVDGRQDSLQLPRLELDQTTCVPLHEHFPGLAEGGRGGTVRLSPSTHQVAGWMIRHDPKRSLWRVQHL